MKPRILIVVENLPVPFDRRVWLECQTLVSAGYQVAVVCPMGEGDPAYEVINSVELYNALAMATNLENALQKAGLPNIEQLKLQIQNAFDFLFTVDEEGKAHVEEVYATELDALRANKNNTDPTRRVRFLPYGIAVSVLDGSPEQPSAAADASDTSDDAE